jgi:hypothetical protein
MTCSEKVSFEGVVYQCSKDAGEHDKHMVSVAGQFIEWMTPETISKRRNRTGQ